MKKRLLMLLAGAAFVFANNSSFAQLPMTNFNTGLPGTWSMIKVDNNTPSTGLATDIQTQMAVKAWMTRLRATGDSCMLTTSMFTPAGTADRWLITPSFTVNGTNMIITWEDAQGVSGATDNIQVWVSPTAGTTVPSFTTKIYDAPVTAYDGGVVFIKKGASLESYNGQTIRLAFRNNSTNGGTSRIDNVGTEVMANQLDGRVDKVEFPKLVATTATIPVKVTVSNGGASTITSLNLSYKIDSGTPITQSFPGLTIPPYGVAVLTFTTPISNPAVGTHTLTVDLLQTNGGADPVASNNQKSTSFAVATQTVPRSGIIEEFSSSTCPPCASFNAVFDPLVVTTNKANDPASKFNIIKYQMNWPSPNNDRSYNSYGLARRTYYGVNAIPDHYTNGVLGGSGNQAEIDASKTAPAYVSLSGTYTIKGDSLIASVTVTPYFTLAGTNFKLHVAAVEEHYSKTESTTFTTTQTEFYHVMRTMFPDGNGTLISNWAAGSPQTFTFRKKFAVGNPQQMNEEFWGNPINSNLVFFLQDDDSKEILQSGAVHAAWSAGVKEITGLSGLNVYPNPAQQEATISFHLEKPANISLEIIDQMGRVVYTVPTQPFQSGQQTVELPVQNLANGIYTVTLKSDGGSINQRLSVMK